MLKWIGAFDIRNFEFLVWFPVTWLLRWDNFVHTVDKRMVYKFDIMCAPFQLQQAMLQKLVDIVLESIVMKKVTVLKLITQM